MRLVCQRRHKNRSSPELKKIVFNDRERFFYVEKCRTIYIDFLNNLYLNKDLSVKEAPPIFFSWGFTFFEKEVILGL